MKYALIGRTSGLLLLAGCTFTPLRIHEQDMTLPGVSSNGMDCFVQIGASVSLAFDYATYTADATCPAAYPLTSSASVELHEYGRSKTPEGYTKDATFCASRSDVLHPLQARSMTVGGKNNGNYVARLIPQPSYELGHPSKVMPFSEPTSKSTWCTASSACTCGVFQNGQTRGAKPTVTMPISTSSGRPMRR
ncbi:MAG TPA: hypothetical protein VF171_06100 [Trueperaceae bacterium]